jgi:DNA-binding beta-propeller fold protein YncE
MKKTTLLFFTTGLLLIAISLCTCVSEKGTPNYNNYPNEIGKLFFTKCATAGCHTDESKGAAAGLSMESWDKLFEGGTNGANIIPYRSDYSTLCYYVNTYSDLGVTLTPTMPYNKSKLTRAEVLLIKNWIDAGAPNNEGVVKFSENPNRKKFYVANQGCDVVTVFDQETLLAMRYINVGATTNIESPHMIKVSPDGAYWYVLFLTGNYLEKYSTSDDSFVGRANIGSGYWNSFTISSDSKTAYCIDLSASGAKIATVNLTSLTTSIQAGFTYPHGSALNKTDDTLYVTQQTNSSKLYKIPVSDFSAYSEINLYTTPPSSALNSHEIRFSPDGNKYAVSCQSTTAPEVRIFETLTDKLLAIIPVGSMPAEMSFSKTTDYLFVSCTEDLINNPGKRGSVAIINYQTNQLVKIIYTGHQPHGIEVDDNKKLVYVINRNASGDGSAPHHTSVCGGRNGNVSFINLNTLEMLTTPTGNIKNTEVAVDPYSVSIRE